MSDQEGDGGRRRRIPRELSARDWNIRPGRIALISVGAIVALIFVIVFLGGLKKTPRDQIGISYGGGPIEGQHFQRVVNPGSNLFFNGLQDRLYMYPVTQRNYIISKRAGEGDVPESDFIVAPSDDRVEVDFETATFFKLNTDKLRQFHEQIGLKYNAWTEEGWIDMLHGSFRQQIEFALQREARRHPVADIFASREVLEAIQKGIAQDLKENVTRILGDEYFCGPTFQAGGRCTDFTFVVKRVTIPDTVKNAFELNRTSEIQVLTKQNEIRQREAEAEAIRKLQDALASGGQNYVLLKAIESGKITFWVLPNGVNVTIPREGGR